MKRDWFFLQDACILIEKIAKVFHCVKRGAKDTGCAMNDNPEAFLKKSRENLSVCDSAIADGNFNAAASRYYYALRLAATSYFWKKGIPPPKISRKGKPVENKENKWTHPKLIDKIGSVLDSKLDAESLFRQAKDLREKGDYKDADVEPHELPKLRTRADAVLTVLLGD